MDQDNYRPPRARLEPHRREPGSILKAVAVGAFIDIGGSFVATFLIATVALFVLMSQGYSEPEAINTLRDISAWSPLWMIFVLAGLGASMLGGYRCAVIANRNNYLAPGLMSLVSVGVSAMLEEPPPLNELLLYSALTVAAVLGGASLYIRSFEAGGPKGRDS
jgi:hypothetical protein